MFVAVGMDWGVENISGVGDTNTCVTPGFGMFTIAMLYGVGVAFEQLGMNSVQKSRTKKR